MSVNVSSDKPPVGTFTRRLSSLDGLRGLAALIVAVFHFGSAFLPWLIPDQTNCPSWLADTPIAIVFNGPFSVSIFFVLSGFVVAQAAARRNAPVYINIPLRFLRLALPAAASTVFAWCLLKLIPTATFDLNIILPHWWLSRTYQAPIPSLASAIYDGLIRTFIRGESRFNNVLWTMQIELIGSVTIYSLYGLTNDRVRIMITIILGMLTLIRPQYLGFVLGSLMRDLWSAGKLWNVYPSIVFTAGILLGFPGRGFADRVNFPHLYHKLTLGASDGLIPPLAAALIIYGTLRSIPLAKIFSGRIIQYLGRISFVLYLVHVPLLYTVFALMFDRFQPLSYLGILGLFFLFLTTSLIAASAGELCIDRPVLYHLRQVRSKFGNRP
jgi:peptidoglycan/LPS O-acetylase OafA/YrhL